MALTKINFQNLPDTTTPVNATNLNQLQTNMENGLLDKRWGYFSAQQSYASLDAFKADVITSTYQTGAYVYYVVISGNARGVFMIKASNSYLSFILFSYNLSAIQYKYSGGTWSEVALG